MSFTEYFQEIKRHAASVDFCQTIIRHQNNCLAPLLKKHGNGILDSSVNESFFSQDPLLKKVSTTIEFFYYQINLLYRSYQFDKKSFRGWCKQLLPGSRRQLFIRFSTLNLSLSSLFTPLRLALVAKNFDAANWLIQSGAKVDSLTLLLSVFLNDTGLLYLSRGNSKLSQYAHRQLLEYALHWNKCSVILNLLAYNSSSDLSKAYDKGRWNPFALAILHCSSKVIEAMLKSHPCLAGMELLHQRRKTTSLHLAVGESRLELLTMLIQHGANVNAVDLFHRTPLHIATRLVGGFLTQFSKRVADNSDSLSLILKMLLELGANPNTVDCYHKTPFMNLLERLSETNMLPLVLLFLYKGANIHVKDDDGRTPLAIAARYGHLECVELLVSLGSNINAVDKDGNTALHLSCRVGCWRITQVLLRNGARANIKNNQSKIAFDLCLSSRGRNLVRRTRRFPSTLQSIALRAHPFHHLNQNLRLRFLPNIKVRIAISNLLRFPLHPS